MEERKIQKQNFWVGVVACAAFCIGMLLATLLISTSLVHAVGVWTIVR